MTVNEWIESFQIGDVRPIPRNCAVSDLIYTAQHQFGVTLWQCGDNIQRVCPHCHEGYKAERLERIRQTLLQSPVRE
jgi:hypothetical protein